MRNHIMNKKHLMLAALAVAAFATVAAKKSGDDPVVMTVNGHDVPLSEFQYLYQKNNTQQAEQQPLEQYVDMFVTYKLKVADAEAAGIDTTASFQKEFAGYRNELARPYLRDTTVYNRLVAEHYARMQEDVDVSHIMIPRGQDPAGDKKQAEVLDSIRSLIVSGKANFTDEALKNSIDPGVRRNSGHMGWMSAGQYPYSFEVTAYNTPVGEISPVIQTDYGHHIILVHQKRPAKGEVHCAHILKLTAKKSEADAAKAKEQIDSIYNVLVNGANFAAVAKAESEDPGSARQGGELPWFGAGRMVPEFEEVAFSLSDGETSKPFATSYGYHIIKKMESKGVPSFEEAKGNIEMLMARDERSRMPEQSRLQELKSTYNSKLNQATVNDIYAQVQANNGLDSVLYQKLCNATAPLVVVGKTTHSTGEVFKGIQFNTKYTVDGAKLWLDGQFAQAVDRITLDTEREALSEKYPEYRNLVNEYRDGMLLFEVSNQNVWEKASKDKEGLEKFFNANRGKYTWENPKYKGYVVFCTNDSLEQVVSAYLKSNVIPADSLAAVTKREFGRDVKIERVIAAQGENAIVDAVAFGGEKPAPSGRWTNYFAYQGRIIPSPEEAADVRGAVTTDYQAELEKQWVASLREKYPYKVNQKVLKKIQ